MTVLLVHGFNHNPKSQGRDNAENYTYPRWLEMLGIEEANYYSWFSVPLTLVNIVRAVLHGRWNRYRWAWDLAHEEGLKLANILRAFPEPADIVCHSLGSRVVLRALELGAPAGRVLILNGAEYANTAAMVAQWRRRVEFFAVIVKEDDVLNKLGRAAPGWGARFVGNTPLGLRAPPNWTDLPLDDPNFQGVMKTLYGWEVAGDNPESIGDHHYSFENENNWPLYRAIFARSWPKEGT